jgi:hypothetical protein
MSAATDARAITLSHEASTRPHAPSDTAVAPPQADGTLPRYANNNHGSRLTPQSWAYDNCILWFGGRHKWIALLDADEFLIITQPQAGAAAAAAAAAAASSASAPNTTGGSSPLPQLERSRPNITAYLQPLEGAATTAVTAAPIC